MSIKYGFMIYEEKLNKCQSFEYKPYEILEYIVGDKYDFIKYKVEMVNKYGNYTEDGLRFEKSRCS